MNKDDGDSTVPQPATPRSQKSPTVKNRPIPPAFKSIQANSCKTPGCDNFGVPPTSGPIQKGRTSADDYVIIGTGSVYLSCKKCGKFSTLKNNEAIHEELQRQGEPLWVNHGMRCPDPACVSHATAAAAFRKFGTTPSGSSRFQCMACKKTLSIGKSTLRQRQPHKNALVFQLLLNKMPFNRMREVAGLSVAGLYGKIDFIYRQCLAFSADRERRLASMSFERRYLCTDRQDYLVNWNDRSEKKTIQLTAVATADLDSGYIFGLLPNFDGAITPDELEAQWLAAGDQSKPIPLRTTARLWTAADYCVSAGSSTADLNAPENLSTGQQLPKTGCQVHADYLMHGHYQLLRHHFQGAKKLRFFSTRILASSALAWEHSPTE